MTLFYLHCPLTFSHVKVFTYPIKHSNGKMESRGMDCECVEKD